MRYRIKIKRCSECDGDGKLQCVHCDDYEAGMVCDYCGNRRYIDCPECNGEGSFEIMEPAWSMDDIKR